VKPGDLGDMAAGIANVLGAAAPVRGDTFGLGSSKRDSQDTAAGTQNGYDNGYDGTQMDKQSGRRSGDDAFISTREQGEYVFVPEHPRASAEKQTQNQNKHTEQNQEEEEDSSVPVDSVFFGVDADEISWDAPLSVRKNRVRPFGMPTLALEKIAPPPDDPDAAMLEFAYEQQYGKERAKEMVDAARRADLGGHAR
jgi:hypothetical protein